MLDLGVCGIQEQHERESKMHGLYKSHLIVDYDQINNISFHQPLISKRIVFFICLLNKYDDSITKLIKGCYTWINLSFFNTSKCNPTGGFPALKTNITYTIYT